MSVGIGVDKPSHRWGCARLHAFDAQARLARREVNALTPLSPPAGRRERVSSLILSQSFCQGLGGQLAVCSRVAVYIVNVEIAKSDDGAHTAGL